MGAYWFLVILFILISLSVSAMAVARARASQVGSAPVVALGLVPALAGIGAAGSMHPGFSLVLTAAAVIFSIWWLNNMAKLGH